MTADHWADGAMSIRKAEILAYLYVESPSISINCQCYYTFGLKVMEPDVEALPMSATDIRSLPTAYISPPIHENGLRYRRIPTAESDEHSIERNVRHSQNITCNAVQSESTLRPDPTANFYDNIRKDLTNSGAEDCIFIAVSTGRSFRIVSVPVKNRKNDVVTWKQIQQCYYEAIGLWRKYNPFHGVTKVSEAKVSVRLYFPSELFILSIKSFDLKGTTLVKILPMFK